MRLVGGKLKERNDPDDVNTDDDCDNNDNT